MSARALAVVAVWSVVATTATVAAAQEYSLRPVRERGGWVIGGNLGWAMADLDLRGDSSLDTGWQGGGTSGKVRLGYVVQPQLLVGLEYGVWRRKEELAATAADALAGQEDRYLGVGTAFLRVFPGPHGLYTHLGVGLGSAWLKVDQGTGSVQTTGSGLAAMLGAGYEHWIDDDIALGAHVEVGALDADEGVGGGFAFFAFSANLYFAGL